MLRAYVIKRLDPVPEEKTYAQSECDGETRPTA